MSLFRKGILPSLCAAGVLVGCVGDASLEGDDQQDTQPEPAESIDPDAAKAAGTAQQALSTNWVCYVRDNDWNSWNSIYIAGYVTIDWGHQSWDATWACNAWRSACGGACWAERR